MKFDTLTTYNSQASSGGSEDGERDNISKSPNSEELWTSLFLFLLSRNISLPNIPYGPFVWEQRRHLKEFFKILNERLVQW